VPDTLKERVFYLGPVGWFCEEGYDAPVAVFSGRIFIPPGRIIRYICRRNE